MNGAARPGRGLGLLLAAAAAGACNRSPSRPDVVLLVVDALRADRLGVGGNPRPVSPHLDALAARGAWFGDALAPAPWTLPSVASLLTGLHPLTHGAGLQGEVVNLDGDLPAGLRADAPTLATAFAAAGYRCEAFVTNAFLRFGLERDFADWRLAATEAAEVVDHAIARLATPGDRPLFLFLHLIDCHDPILVPDEDLLAVAALDPEPAFPPFWSRRFVAYPQFSEAFRAPRLLAYDAAVRYVDRHVGRLLEAIGRRQADRPAIVAVTADHGEELLDWLGPLEESRRWDPRGRRGDGHGHSLSGIALHVPLILAGPGVAPGRIPDQVSLIDVAPTLLDLAAVRPGRERFDGRSLRPLLEGGSLPPSPLLAGSVGYGFRQKAWITPEWKLVVSENLEECPLLFDRVHDRGESLNLAPSQPELVERLAAAAREEEARLGRSAGETADLSEEDRRRLRAVGYLGGGR